MQALSAQATHPVSPGPALAARTATSARPAQPRPGLPVTEAVGTANEYELLQEQVRLH